jgi:hypothetical protein
MLLGSKINLANPTRRSTSTAKTEEKFRPLWQFDPDTRFPFFDIGIGNGGLPLGLPLETLRLLV